jgi:hypothetical protein
MIREERGGSIKEFKGNTPSSSLHFKGLCMHTLILVNVVHKSIPPPPLRPKGSNEKCTIIIEISNRLDLFNNMHNIMVKTYICTYSSWNAQMQFRQLQ